MLSEEVQSFALVVLQYIEAVTFMHVSSINIPLASTTTLDPVNASVEFTNLIFRSSVMLAGDYLSNFQQPLHFHLLNVTRS
jgi:hypothetical protein